MSDNYYDDGGAAAAAAAILIGLFFVLLLVGIVFYVISSFFYMKLFEKAGVQGKWRAWVPVYNTLVFAKLGDLSPWWLLILWVGPIVLSWIPVLNIIGSLASIAAGVYLILAAYRVGQKLQKEGAWVVLYIFLSIVWLGIVALDRSRWNQAVPPAPWANSFLADKTVWDGVPVQTPVGGYGQPGQAAPGYGAPGAYPPPAQPYNPPAQPYSPPAQQTPPPSAPYTPPTEPPAAPEPPAGPPRA